MIDINTTQRLHFDIQGCTETECFGVIESTDKYKNKQLVDREYYCTECGQSWLEAEMEQREEELELRKVFN